MRSAHGTPERGGGVPRRLLGLLPLALAACAEDGGLRPGNLVRDIRLDPTTQAINRARSAFASEARLAGRPAAAARAVADVEFLAVELQGLRFVGADPLVAPSMRAARDELRGMLDIDPNVPAQPVIDALIAAANAIDDGGDPIIPLSRPFFRAGAPVTLMRLNALPPAPRTVQATARAAGMIARTGPPGDR